MEADLIFHNVGQGLFYSGQIRCPNSHPFNFVYDCGGTENAPNSKSSTLDTCIKQYKKYLKEEPIDLLVISHFHNDHTNGIARLLEKQKVKEVVIPFYTFEERLLILLNEYHSKMTKSQISFLLNPYQFLSEQDVQRIIVVIHQENTDGMSVDNPVHMDDLKDNIPDGAEYDEFRECQTRITVITDEQPIKKGCWNFAFYADDRQKGIFDLSKAKQGIDDLKNATNQSDRRTAVKKIKASYNLKSGQMNETSFIMVHKIDSELRFISPFPYHIHSKYHLFGYCHNLWISSNHVHILTGDFDFKNKSWVA